MTHTFRSSIAAVLAAGALVLIATSGLADESQPAQCGADAAGTKKDCEVVATSDTGQAGTVVRSVLPAATELSTPDCGPRIYPDCPGYNMK